MGPYAIREEVFTKYAYLLSAKTSKKKGKVLYWINTLSILKWSFANILNTGFGHTEDGSIKSQTSHKIFDILFIPTQFQLYLKLRLKLNDKIKNKNNSFKTDWSPFFSLLMCTRI